MSSESRCPICHTPLLGERETREYSPFCSSRCKLVDLSHWLNEGYRISTPLDDLSPEDDPTLN